MTWDQGVGAVAIDKNYHSYMYSNVDQDKAKRLMDYRIMAQYAEVGDALDEICDDSINVDENTGKLVNIDFRDSDLTEAAKSELTKEFDKLMKYFEFESKGWEYYRNLLIDGEVYYEHIIHEEHVEQGILGILVIPTELIDPIYDNVQNTLIKGYLYRQPIIDPKTQQVEKYEYIPFDKNQCTYVHSGIWNGDKTLRLPFIENCRRSYRQLTMVEDSIVVYRLVRAPEKLVFNVDVGNMPPPKAEAYLKKLMHNYWNRKTFDAAQDGQVNTFNPQSMLDSFWFAKRAGNTGTEVTQLAGGANLGELTDLMYFVKKLYKALKVPGSRLEAETSYSDGTEILREELKFAKFIMRQHQRFAEALKNTFVTQLKMKKLWKEYDLKEDNIHVEFNAPNSFHAMREQQIFEIKSGNFATMSGNDMVSNTYCQKKYLDWTDKDVIANRAFLKKDKELMWELTQIESQGPNWREAMEGAEGAEGEGDMGMGGDMGGALPPAGDVGAPPDFGGMPDDMADAGAEAPPVEEPPVV
tara:strand:+ start:13147 stop:14721 length:1575 start_codon:yes stop_codon:yes gene_type:complete